MILFLAVWLSASSSFGATLESDVQFLKAQKEQTESVIKSLNGPAVSCADAKVGAMPEPLWFGRAPENWSKLHSPCKTELKVFCKNVEDFHVQTHLPVSDFEGRSNLVAKRQGSPEHLKRKKEYITKFFDQSRKNGELQSTCCDRDERCALQFSNTQLQIVDDSQIPRYPEYDEMTHSVVVPEGWLLEYTYEEEIEYFVLHELGHSCDRANYPNGMPSPVPGQNFVAEEELKHFKTRWSEDFTKCIGEFEKQAPSGGAKYLSEAFAEAIFARFWRSPLNWSSCRAITSHYGVEAALECLFKIPSAKKQICP